MLYHKKWVEYQEMIEYQELVEYQQLTELAAYVLLCHTTHTKPNFNRSTRTGRRPDMVPAFAWLLG
jgi:hypothetical protein